VGFEPTRIEKHHEIADRFAADIKYFKLLVDATAKNFALSEVSADKAYLSAANLQTVITTMVCLPFRSRAIACPLGHRIKAARGGVEEECHKRSNVESTFSMIKAKFGDSLRSKTKTAQVNEALCKILCHNICCLINPFSNSALSRHFGPPDKTRKPLESHPPGFRTV
jgi:hypothetical protein